MKVFLLLGFIVASPMAAAIPFGEACGKFSTTTRVSVPLTIAEIERQEMSLLSAYLKIREDYPKVPFGFGNAEWVAFKSMFKPGDKIVRYTTDQHSWEHLAGEAGYALMRSGCIVRTFTTMMN